MKIQNIIGVVVAVTLVITPIALANSIGVPFIVMIDRVSPTYSNFSSNTSVVNGLNESIKFSAFWQDNFWLGDWKFEWNITNSWVNDTVSSFNNSPKNDWSNVTKIIDDPTYEGKIVAFRFYASDIFNYWNSTELKSFSILSQAPVWSSLGPDNGSPVSEGQNITLYSFWNDNFNVETAVLELNTSGTFVDNGSVAINDVFGWSNFTLNTTGMSGDVYWKIRVNDSVNNLNTTDVRYFTVS